MKHQASGGQSTVLCCWVFGLWCCANTLGQNVVEDRATGPIAPPIQVSEAQSLAIVNHSAGLPGQSTNRDVKRFAVKLDKHVQEFLGGFPWMPFHHTLGISGYEVYFNHPDQMFYALSLALPHLPRETAGKTRALLARQLSEAPPYAVEGFDPRAGHLRESYTVPANLRANGRGTARSAFGVYAFWSYVHATGDSAGAKTHWAAVRQRMQGLLDQDYKFDPAKRDYKRDEAELLNGNLAALIATIRLARTNADSAIERKALRRTTELLELRVNLERLNPRILETTDSSTKHLHASKIPRFCDLTLEVGDAVRTLTEGCGAAHLGDFREARNGWYLAFGERMIGGENYTNPLHFSRALFAGAVLVEQLPPEQIAAFVDVPWCKGDFYFIEKCALALSIAR